MRSILAVSLLATFGALACSQVPGGSDTVGSAEAQWKERPAEWTCQPCQAGAKRECAGLLSAQPPFPAPSPTSCTLSWNELPAKAQTCDEDGNWGSCSFPKEQFDKLMSADCEVKHFAKEGGQAATVESFSPKTLEVAARATGTIKIKGTGFDGRAWIGGESLFRAGDVAAPVGEIKTVSDSEIEVTLPAPLEGAARNPGYLSLAACPKDNANCFAPAILTVGPILYTQVQPFEVFDACPDPSDGTGEKPIVLSGTGFSRTESIAWAGQGATIVSNNYIRFQPESNETAETIRHDGVELAFKMKETGAQGTYTLPMPISIAPNPYRIEISDVSPKSVPSNQPSTITLKGRGFGSGAVLRTVTAFGPASDVQAQGNDALTFTFDPSKVGSTRNLCARVEITFSAPGSEKIRTVTSAADKCISVQQAP
jgi:hypothetical protein